MKSVVLRLEGPLQSWGTQGRFSERDTDSEPSKSGVLGLVGAALGMSRDDEARLEALNGLEMAVRVDREGRLLRDFHTVGGGQFPGVKNYSVSGTKDPVLTNRYYLMDASFVVALGGDEALVESLAHALRDPVYPLFLGRRSCTPSAPVLIGVVAESAAEAARGASWTERHDKGPKARLIMDALGGQEGVPRNDVAVSFRLGARRFVRRLVRTEWVDVPATTSEIQENGS